MTQYTDQTELANLVRNVLLTEWDPIGIREFLADDYDAVRDEYDAYVPTVVHMIVEGSAKSDIEEFLFTTERQKMHRRRPRDFAASAAESLGKIWQARQPAA